MKNKFNELSVIIKISRPNGWRTEWDIAFRDGGPLWVTLTQFTARNEVQSTTRITAQKFFDEFFTQITGTNPVQEDHNE